MWSEGGWHCGEESIGMNSTHSQGTPWGSAHGDAAAVLSVGHCP